MRTLRTALLSGLAFLLSAGVAWPCGFLILPMKLPGLIARSVLRGHLLHAVSLDGHLFTVDLLANSVRTVHKFTHLHPVLDVAGDKAVVVEDYAVTVVDLKEGKVLWQQFWYARGAGFLDDQRVFVLSGHRLGIFNLTELEPRHIIDLGKIGKVAGPIGVIDDGKDKRLVAPLGSERPTLAVIDPEQAKVIDEVSLTGMTLGTIDTAADLKAVGNKVYIVSWRLQDGTWTESFGCVDLIHRQFTLLKLPAGPIRGRHLAVGAGGRIFLTSAEGTDQYDAEGKLVGPAFSNQGEVVGWSLGDTLLVQGKVLSGSRWIRAQVPKK
jgi:hypothetical protein